MPTPPTRTPAISMQFVHARRPAVQRLADIVSEVANTSQHGGRCSVINGTSCALYDVSQWNDNMTAVVRTHFPHCLVSINTLDSSVSGFAVVFTLHEADHRARDTLLCVLMVVTMGTVLQAMFWLTFDLIPVAPQDVLATFEQARMILRTVSAPEASSHADT